VPAAAPAAAGAAPGGPEAAVSLVPGQTLREATDAFQRAWIEATLARHGASMAAAAREAGMDRSNFHRLARRLGLAAGRRGALG
jgi:anaerobic nitric oxide reductase transcription regulator